MQPIHRFQPSGVRSHIAPSHQPESHSQSEFGGSHDDESIDGESDGDGSSDSDDFGGDSNGDDDGDNAVNDDGDRFSNEFSDCSDGDGFDWVESLLLDENPISDDMFAPLYPGASITICAAYCAIMTYAIANKLSYSAIENLLKLLHLLCPSSHQIPSSLYMLKKFFQQYTSSYEKKRVCPSCHCVLKKGETCPRSHGQNGHMIHVPIEKALKSVVLSKLIYTCIIKIVTCCNFVRYTTVHKTCHLLAASHLCSLFI